MQMKDVLKKRLADLKKATDVVSDPLVIPDHDVTLVLGIVPHESEKEATVYINEFASRPDYIYVLKREIVSRSVRSIQWSDGVALNTLETPFIEEDGEDGNPVERPATEVVRDILKTWGSPVIDRLYEVYRDLNHRFSEKVDKTIKVEIPPTRRAQELNRLLVRANQLVIDMMEDPAQPEDDLKKAVESLTTASRIAVMASRARSIEVQAVYDFSADPDKKTDAGSSKRDWSSIKPEEEVTDEVTGGEYSVGLKQQEQRQVDAAQRSGSATGVPVPAARVVKTDEDEIVPAPIPKR